MTEPGTAENLVAREEHTLRLRLDSFTWELIMSDAASEGITAEELVTFSVMYYLADVDSGRIARRGSATKLAEARPLEASLGS